MSKTDIGVLGQGGGVHWGWGSEAFGKRDGNDVNVEWR